MTRLGDELRRLRLARSFTLEFLAEKSGVDRLAIMRIEQGDTKNPRELNLIALSQSLGQEQSHLSQFVEGGLSRSKHKNWNVPGRRGRLVAAIAGSLSDSPEEETHFVDYNDVLEETKWLGEPRVIQTTTFEYSKIWLNRNVFVPYEASLLYYRRRGLDLRRFFIVDPCRLREPAYAGAVATTLTRHLRLDLQPRVLMAQDNRSMSRDIGAKCEALVILDERHSLLIGQQGENEPFMLSTRSHSFSRKASKVFAGFWRGSRAADDFLNHVEKLPAEQLALIEQDAETVRLECDFKCER